MIHLLVLSKVSLSPSKTVFVCFLNIFVSSWITTRFLQKPLQLRGGLTVPKGSSVFVPITIIQHSERHFPKPEEFRPDRWVKRNDASGRWEEREESDESGSIQAANRGAFLAFSAGGRSCPGQKFALQEAVLVLSVLLKELKFSAVPGYKLVPVRNGVVQHPEGGIPMKIEARVS